LPIVRKTYNAEVILTLEDYSKDGVFSEKDVMMAAIEAEVAVNSLGIIDYQGNSLALRLHLKGEKNGDNQNPDMA